MFSQGCEQPLDSILFDEANIFYTKPDKTEESEDSNYTEPPRGAQIAILSAGHSLELARFRLPPEHYGELLSFSQFTDKLASNPYSVLTPGYQWSILLNDHPMAPWLSFDHVRNPWGMLAYPLALRLPENSVVRLVIRNLDVDQKDTERWLRRVGGRLVGIYWFDEHHGGPSSLRTRQPWLQQNSMRR